MKENYFYRLRKYASDLRIFLLDLVFPVKCLSCNQEGEWICKNCLEKIPIKNTQQCFFCGKNNLLGEICRTCRTDKNIDGIFVCSTYKEMVVSQAIKNFKYGFVKDLANPLSKIIIKSIKNLFSDYEKNYFWPTSRKKFIKDFNGFLVIPVPLHKKRKNWRGFNQSAELAERFATEFRLNIDSSVLFRKTFRGPQTKLDKEQRFKNVAGAFYWNCNNLAGRNVILVDDVCTSSATLQECAKILKQNGAGLIWGLVIARN